MIVLLWVGLISLWATINTAPIAAEISDSPATPTDSDTIAKRVEHLLSQMSLEQKVGQLLMVGFGGQALKPDNQRLLKGFHVGAVTLYSRNIRNNAQLSELIHSIRETMVDEVQPFVALDQEGGTVIRVPSPVVVLPGAMLLGATRDPVLAFLAGQATAIELKLLGVDMNLAPVLDINNNPLNPVINVRAFGDNPRLVSSLGGWFIRGQQGGGLATVAKHFPGHGATAHDSHYALPSLPVSLEELRRTELIPFQEAIAAGLDAVMTAHVQVPAVDPDGTPASLSARLLTGLLREELGFDGLVITDDLEMRAIIEERGVGTAAVQAILAGADMVMVIWTPTRKAEVFQALLEACSDGTIPLDRLHVSVRRILRLKAQRGTLDAIGRPVQDLSRVLPNPEHTWVTDSISTRGLTLVRNENGLIPFCRGDGLLVAGPAVFVSELKRLLPGSEGMVLHSVPSEKQRKEDLDRLTELSSDRLQVVVGISNAYQAWIAQGFLKRVTKPTMVVSFGSPYWLKHFPSVPGYLCAYSTLTGVQRAAAAALANRQPLTGRLPVDLSNVYHRGHGLEIRPHSCSKTKAP